jgi:hypothetical protein
VCSGVRMECGVWVHSLFLLVYEGVAVALVVWAVKFGGVMFVRWFSCLRVCDSGGVF